ncbi:MAG: hypothetical protein QGG74_06780, partial [Phycisphaerales bacterium]|nr:hypothetical protein [Phycisphaerales bacterium]
MRTHTHVLVACAAAAGMFSVPDAAQAGDAVVLYSAGIDGWLDDPKDAGLHAALVMMQENGLSLPPNMGPAESHAANLIADVALSELDVRVVMREPSGPGGMPFGFTVASRGNAGTSADSLLEQLTTLLQTVGAPTGAPDPERPGFLKIDRQRGGPPVWLGTESAGDQTTAVLSVNMPPESTDTDWSGSGLPVGTDPLFGGLIDFNEMQPLLGMAAMAGPQVATSLSKLGLTGPDAMRMEFAGWRDGGSIRFGGRISNYGDHYGDMLVEGGVGKQQLQAVPSDTVGMQVNRFNIRGMCDSMFDLADGMMAPMMGDAEKLPMSPSEMMCAQAKMAIGINPKTEFIDYLGDSLVFYRSRSTGGDGLMSSVMLLGLSNADGMATTLGGLASRINGMVTPLSQGYVQMTTWSHPDCGEVIALTFPGLPVPVELSMVVKDDWFVATLNPQAMVAACRQLSASTSVLDNPRFTSAVGNSGIGTVQVNFCDLPAQLDRGYGIAVGLMSAVSNYTRPRRDAGAGVPMILPPYADLIEGAEPWVLLAEMSGDDLVYTGGCDSSVNVLITGT